MNEEEWAALKEELRMIEDGHPEVSVATAPRLPSDSHPPFLLAAVTLKEKGPADGEGQQAEAEEMNPLLHCITEREHRMQYEELFENNPPSDLSFMRDLVGGLGKERVEFRRWSLEGNGQSLLCMEGLLVYRPFIGNGTPIYIRIEFEEERTSFWLRDREMHVEITGCADGSFIAAMVKQMYVHSLQDRTEGEGK